VLVGKFVVKGGFFGGAGRRGHRGGIPRCP
jgi:hypothetical protein